MKCRNNYVKSAASAGRRQARINALEPESQRTTESRRWAARGPPPGSPAEARHHGLPAGSPARQLQQRLKRPDSPKAPAGENPTTVISTERRSTVRNPEPEPAHPAKPSESARPLPLHLAVKTARRTTVPDIVTRKLRRSAQLDRPGTVDTIGDRPEARRCPAHVGNACRVTSPAASPTRRQRAGSPATLPE